MVTVCSFQCASSKCAATALDSSSSSTAQRPERAGCERAGGLDDVRTNKFLPAREEKLKFSVYTAAGSIYSGGVRRSEQRRVL